jgi:hypothetical protein
MCARVCVCVKQELGTIHSKLVRRNAVRHVADLKQRHDCHEVRTVGEQREQGFRDAAVRAATADAAGSKMLQIARQMHARVPGVYSMAIRHLKQRLNTRIMPARETVSKDRGAMVPIARPSFRAQVRRHRRTRPATCAGAALG